jgi:hypothetical protein
MAMPLRKMENYWEAGGISFGLLGCAAIAIQIVHLYQTKTSISLSYLNIALWMMNYAFWCAYGFRFKRIAVWCTNLVATALQVVLLVCYFIFR